jgi:F-type H+-transporting ATPase subunit beta
VLSREISSLGIYPVGRPARFDLAPDRPERRRRRSLHDDSPRAGALQRYKELRDIIAILGMMSWRRKTSWRCRARKIQRFLSAALPRRRGVHWLAGKSVSLKETIRGFKMIVDGECDAFRAGLLHGRHD